MSWRQPRPRWAPSALLVAVTVVAVIVIPGRAGNGGGVFVQPPYMGVSCGTPNSIACDRVGLSVWLARPATVTATIAGAPLQLDDPGWSYVAREGRRRVYVYAGFLYPAGLIPRLHVVPVGGLRWLGAHAPTPRVRFRIDYGGGDVVVTNERVWLHAGWG